MNFSYDIFPEQRLITLRYSGRMSFQELKAATEQIWSDPRYSADFDGLVDASDGSFVLELKDLRQLIEFVRVSAQASRGRWAAVAVSPVITALGFFYQKAMAKWHTVEVFSTREAACRFLGVGFSVGSAAPWRMGMARPAKPKTS